MKRIRVALGVIILLISLCILAWSFWPARRETRILPVYPTEMTLPTPGAGLVDPPGLQAPVPAVAVPRLRPDCSA